MTETDVSRYLFTKKIPYVKPLYAVSYKKEEDVLDWLREAEEALNDYLFAHFNEQKANLSYVFNSGINPNFSNPFFSASGVSSDIYSTSDSLYVNQMYRVVMDQVSLVVSNEIVPDVLPHNDEYKDKVAAKVTREWLESMSYDLDIEAWRFKWEMQKKIYGESYAIVMWNPQKGDLHPDAKENNVEDMDYLDEDGQTVEDEGGETVKIKKNLRIGDIEIHNPFPWDVQEDPRFRQEDRLWFYWKEYVDVDYLKKEYPKKDWDTTKFPTQYYDGQSGSNKDDPNRRTIYYIYHKSCKFMPEGRFIVCSLDYMLKNGPLEMPTIINDEVLPLVRFQDLQIGATIRGTAILFRNVKSLADGYNKVTNQMYHNVDMESPKLFVHVSSRVDGDRMPNGMMRIEWDGNQKPTIETPTSNTPAIFNFRDGIKKDIDEVSLQTPMVRGDTPNAQMDSFVALQHFEDLRNQLAGPDIKSHLRAMEHLYKLMITVAKDKYKKDDKRLVKILGKNNAYQLKYFDPQNLGKIYDVKIMTTGNLANSKAARTQMMITIKRDFPHLLADELFMDSLGLSQNKKFMNAITSAVSSAEAENQSMMDGEEVSNAVRYEDLITHWETHKIPMQTSDFKYAPDEVKDLLLSHLAGTEKLMFEQKSEGEKSGSMVFSDRLAQLRQFPVIYTPEPVNEMPLLPPMEGEIPPEAPMPPAAPEALPSEQPNLPG